MGDQFLKNARKLLLGRWFNVKSHADRLQEQLEAELRERADVLFREYDARVIPNTETYPTGFDYAVVTIAVHHVLLRFIRGRGDFRVDVAPSVNPSAWKEASFVAKNSSHSDSTAKLDYFGLNDVGRFLQSNLTVLELEAAKPNWKTSPGWLTPI